MGSSKQKLFIFVNILSVIQVSLLETVHFTNSPRKILKANNYTTYKVEVPNGDPITIIEANTPLIDKRIKFNQVENAGKYSIHHDRNKQVVDLETSLSMTVTPNNNYRDEYENSAAVAASEEESVTNDYSNLSHEHNHKRNSMKTVYSPELLQKFLKDYANKIHSPSLSSSSSSASNEHNVQHNQFNDDDRRFEQLEHASGSIELNPNDGVKGDKYASIETAEDPISADDGNRRVSTTNEDDKNESADLNDIQQRKNYRPNGNYNNNHPYNKNSGWVTLDAVPWSKSKVSKWQSHNVNKYGSQNNYNYPNYNNNNNQRPPYRPTNDYDFDYNGNNDDYYSPPKPSRPTYHNNQFYSGGSSYPPQNNNNNNNRPPSGHGDSWYQSTSSHHHSSSPYNFERPENPQRPYQPDIITDNRPSNFPSHHHEDHHQHHHHNEHHHNEHHQNNNNNNNNNNPFNNRPPYNRPPQNEYNYHGGNLYSYKDGSHPPTYPHNGEGEWILVSTTKGYQFPKRSGQRAMSFIAQNGVNSDSKYPDNKGIITAAESQKVDTVIRPHRRTGPTKMTQQQVKLTVLPLFVNDPAVHGSPSSNNDVNMGVFRPSTYDGLIETAQGSQTVEESAANANENNAVSAVPVNKTKKKRKVMKNYLMRKNAGNSDSSAVIAAVGASLLPASLGLIAPMVLGK